jgi:hypothetical protein
MEVYMADPRESRWLFPWVPIGLVTAVLGAIVGVLLMHHPAPEAVAAPAAQAAAGFQTTEKLVLTINLPALPEGQRAADLVVELLDPDGKVMHDHSRAVQLTTQPASERVEFRPAKLAADKVTVRCRLDKEKVEVPLAKILLVKAHETALSTGQEFHAGSKAALRCEIHGVKSVSETIPLANAAIEIQLRGKDNQVIPVYKGNSGADGVAAVEFKVPAVASGDYKMEVVTRSTLGEEKLERDIKVKTAPKVLLVTDKPLYQPGQVMHIRALSLQAFDLAPVAGKDILFEVEDAKGNKVFKRSFQTSEYGIAAVDFQLADEVNTGDYHVRAILGDQPPADKTVTVKPYVLPKFKSELKADKRFYLPKETINGSLQTDYFFGKPVANAKVKVTASSFDVAFKEFQTFNGTTDANGHVKFEIKLPDYFVGQPLDKGNALVKLEAKVTDTADHSETITKTYPVSNQPVQVSLIAEGGRLVPGMENRVFAAAIYPDGSPAQCDVNLWLGQKRDDKKPFASVKTNDAGLAEFRLTPKAEQFRAGDWGSRKVEMLGGNMPEVWGQHQLLDLFVEAKDSKGHAAHQALALNSDPIGENVILRLDKAIYKGGESVKVDVRSSAGMPTVYLDVVRSGQTLLTKWLDVKDGKADYKLDLSPSMYGTLEVHAYQVLGSGEIIRDSRIVYVHSPADLKIDVKADREVYKPGEQGQIRFQVSDATGKPTAAALGILVVDEAVYALQEMQPGLEKVYFTLQEELLKPQAQVVYKPRDNIDTLVRESDLPAEKQQIAEVLLTAVKPKVPARWEVNPAFERTQKAQAQIAQIGWNLFQYATAQPVLTSPKDGKVQFQPDLLDKLAKAYGWKAELLTDPVGTPLTLESLARLEKGFNPDALARAITFHRLQQIYWVVGQYTTSQQAKYFKDGKWNLPRQVLADAAKQQGLPEVWLKDCWGHPLQLVLRDKKLENPHGFGAFDFHELVSVGPDGKLDTADDVRAPNPAVAQHVQVWWLRDSRQIQAVQQGFQRLQLGQFQNEMLLFGAPGGPAGLGGAGFPRPEAARFAQLENIALQANAPALDATTAKIATKTEGTGKESVTTAPAGAPAVRLREYFPETLFWKPALITDNKGVALLPLDFADSITTWRLTASASSKGGQLGGTTIPLRVFQDFFVDLDLPLNLTQNDEVSFPVAVFNYLKEAQTITLELQPGEWFELTDGLGLTRKLDLKPGEVTSVKFRIRAKRIGAFPLTVKASGTKMSDAIKRPIDVVPDGKKIEQVFADRLTGRISQTIIIPDNALPDASKLLVKVYPGVMSQVLEGTEGLLRLPGG